VGCQTPLLLLLLRLQQHMQHQPAAAPAAYAVPGWQQSLASRLMRIADVQTVAAAAAAAAVFDQG
jgi:hypothetical protein